MAVLVERLGAPASVPRLGRFRAMVVVADPTTRAAVVEELQTLGAVEVAEAASVGEARARARATAARDLLVAEVGLPDGSGIGLLAELRLAGWSRGLVLSSGEDPYTVRAALAAGIRGFLVAPPAGPGVRSAPAFRGRERAADGLSAREVEVLALVAGGRSNREIGEDLGLSALTVKSHLARVARKLGTGDRAEMVYLALRAGLIS